MRFSTSGALGTNCLEALLCSYCQTCVSVDLQLCWLLRDRSAQVEELWKLVAEMRDHGEKQELGAAADHEVVDVFLLDRFVTLLCQDFERNSFREAASDAADDEDTSRDAYSDSETEYSQSEIEPVSEAGLSRVSVVWHLGAAAWHHEGWPCKLWFGS